MNDHFVNIKVDREERPDLDSVYMDAVVAMTGQGGWPMTVFLTPDGRAVLRRHVLPARAAPRPAELPPGARRRRARPTASAAPTSTGRARSWSPTSAQASEAPPSTEPLTESMLAEARGGLREGFDPRVGRLRASAQVPARVRDRVPPARAAISSRSSATLDGMALGGMYDLLGGGFHRYSVDERWLVPHFEKMLYDNALLVPRLSPRLAVTGRSAAARSPKRRRLPRPRAAPAGRWLRVRAGRRHGRRRRADVHVDRGGRRAG